MGQSGSKPAPKPSQSPFQNPFQNSFQNSQFVASFKERFQRRADDGAAESPRPSIFSTLRPPRAKPNNFIDLFNDCISAASSRTQEYLLFKDPEDKFRPSTEVLTQVFLMTYITRSVDLNMTDTFNCTAMTPEQRVLLGADWVWAKLDKPSKNPQIQIAVQVLHLQAKEEEEDEEDGVSPEAFSESVLIAHCESGNNTRYERLVDFCTSVGKDCYALFLFVGKKSDRGNIYGVLSNNFEAAIGKCDKINRAFVENFFKGSRYLYTPSGMMQAVVSKKDGDALTLMIKFS